MSRTHVQNLGNAAIRRVVRRPGRRGAALRLGVLALALDGGSVAVASEPTPAPDPMRQQFAAWVGQAAMHSGGDVASLTEVELDGVAGSEFVARVCHDEGWSETLLIQSAGHRWEVAHASWGHMPVCAIPTDAARWHATTDEVRLVDTGPGSGAERRLAIIDDQLVINEEWSSEDAKITEARWDLGSRRHAGCQGRVLPVRTGNAVAPESGPSFVTEGRAHWSGTSDADLRAVVERRAGGSLLLRVEFSDDQPRLGPTGDGVDVHWVDPGSHELRRVRIRSDEIGRLQVVSAGGGPVAPAVHGEVHRFELVLPMKIAAREPFSMPMTVAVLDVDDEGTTTLATSQFDGEPTSLGLMRYVPGGGDYERAGRRVADASRYDALPGPPRQRD